MNEFGNFIQKKRQSLGLTIRHAASLIGVSPTFLCDLESGDRAFPLNSRKGDLSASFASAYKMNEAEIADFKKMSELCAASLYPQTNIDIVVKDKMLVINHTDLWNRVAKLSEGFDGRILVRASGTEPKIRIMTECSDAEKGRKAASELAELVKNI